MVPTSASFPALANACGAIRIGKLTAALTSALLLGVIASPAAASPEAQTRVIRCDTGSCLLVRGHRDDPAAIVSINGQTVPVAGKREWRVVVPVDTVRQWSEPHAREIEISLRDPDTREHTNYTIDLPIGLLSNATDLSDIEISL